MPRFGAALEGCDIEPFMRRDVIDANALPCGICETQIVQCIHLATTRCSFKLLERIAIDIRKINEFGIGTYIWNLVRSIGTVDTANEYFLIGSEKNYQELGSLPANFSHFRREATSLWGDQLLLPMALMK